MKVKDLQKMLSEANPEADVLFDVEGFYNDEDFDALEIVAIQELDDEGESMVILHSKIPIDYDVNLN